MQFNMIIAYDLEIMLHICLWTTDNCSASFVQ